MDMLDPRDYLYSLPDRVDPVVLEGHYTIFHFEVNGLGEYTVHVEDGRIMVAEGLNGVAVCKVITSHDHFSRLINKQMKPMEAMMTGKLRISNLSEMIKYASIFGLV